MTKIATEELARAIRGHALRMVHRSGAPHIGSCLSIADLLAVLYGKILRLDSERPDCPERDRFILSKGHAAAILYAVLAERGFIPMSLLDTYCRDGSVLAGHVSHAVPGAEFSTGSLGHGLSVGCGMAIGAKREAHSWRTFVLLSDGELDEGSTWEAILFAAHHRLDNLVAIVDHNGYQATGRIEEVLDLGSIAEKLRAFRWVVRSVDGHDGDQIEQVLSEVPFAPGSPSAVIAHTIKGKGVSFMEGRLEWHYRSPDAEQLKAALAEMGHEE